MNDQTNPPPTLPERLDAALALVAQQAQELEGVRSSLSWRITKPLRAAKALLRRSDDAPGATQEPALPAPDSAGAPARVAPPRAATATSNAPERFRPDFRDSAGLWQQPWRDSPGPPEWVYEIPTMLDARELQLLHWLTSTYYTGEGKILDGGCFVGGSTAALASGLEGRTDLSTDGPPIVTYDLFELDPFMLNFFPEHPELEEGDSFRPFYDRNLAGQSHLLTVREGDITKFGWSGEPIEIAFLDLLKTWRISDYVLENFFGHLIPGRSIVVQQDFVHEFDPWIHVTMGMLDPYFETLDFLERFSSVYLLREPIPEEVLRTQTRKDLSAEQLVEYMDVAIAPTGGEIRGVLEVAKANLLRQVEGEDAMAAHLELIRSEYKSLRVLEGAKMIEAWSALVGTWGIKLRGRR
jgi:hypothetical protein